MSQATLAQSDTKWEEAAARIVDLTRQSKIKWAAVNAADVPSYGYSTRTLAAYDASYAGKTLRLIETGFMPRANGVLVPGRHVTGTKEADADNIIGTGVSLKIVDDFGTALFVFPATEAINQLLSEIKSQLADVDGFLEALYKE